MNLFVSTEFEHDFKPSVDVIVFGRFFQVYEFFDHDVIEGFPSATVPLYPRRCVKSYEGYLAIVLLHPKGFAPQLHGIADLP